MKRKFPCRFNEDGLLVAGCYEAKVYGIHHCTCSNAAHKQCDQMLERLEALEKQVKKLEHALARTEK